MFTKDVIVFGIWSLLAPYKWPLKYLRKIILPFANVGNVLDNFENYFCH
jgi:hypothetical protein